MITKSFSKILTNLILNWITCVFIFLTALQAQDLEFIKTKTVDGFYIGVFSSQFTTNVTSTDNKLNFCIWRTSADNPSNVYIPTAPAYIYQLQLVDTNGSALPKTKLGEGIGVKFSDLKPTFLNDNGYRLAIERAMIQPNIGAQNLFFPAKSGEGLKSIYSPNDLFKINQPGDYILQIRFQIIISSNKENAHLIRFPVLNYPLVKPDITLQKQ